MTYEEMRIRQAWPYDVKVAHAKRVAGEFIDKVSAGIEYGGEKGNKYQAHNVHMQLRNPLPKRSIVSPSL